MTSSSPDPLNRPKMYRIRPYFEIKKVKLPDCMYVLKPVHKLTHSTQPSKEADSSALSYLEKRQEWVLSQIEQLKEKVKQLGKKFGVGPDEVGVLQQQASMAETPREVVINCPISSPPHIFRTLYRYISGCIPSAYRVHAHSSVSGHVNANLMKFLEDLPTSPRPLLKLVLIWKSEKDCPMATMVVSPHNQTPVAGQANICRYLCREYFPVLYEESPGGLDAATQMDSWMDEVSTTLQRGSSREQASVVRRLNAQLGSSSFLAGTDVPSVADLLAYTVLCGQPGLKIPGNVKQWLKRVREGVLNSDLCPCPYLEGLN